MINLHPDPATQPKKGETIEEYIRRREAELNIPDRAVYGPPKPPADTRPAGLQFAPGWAQIVYEEADKGFHNVYALLKAWGSPDWLAWLAAAFMVPFVLAAAAILGLIFGFTQYVAAPVAITMLEIIQKARHDMAPQLNPIIAAAISELFGTEISGSDLPVGSSPSETLRRAQMIGRKITDVLESEFVPASRNGVLSPEQGELASKAFTGFTANFSISSAFITIVAELIGGEHGAGFRELGVELAENLGLGRLQKRGLSELVSTTVSEPYQWFLNRKYRPTRLSLGQILTALKRGAMTRATAEYEISLKGYAENLIDILLFDVAKPVSLSDLARAVRFGLITFDMAVAALGDLGYSDAEAQAHLKSEDYSRQDTKWAEYVNALESSYVNGMLFVSELSGKLARVPLSAGERDLELDIAKEKRHAAEKQPSFAQVQDMYYRGQIHRQDFVDYLAAENWGDKWRLPLLDMPGAELTLAQMQKAYIDGVVDLGDWRAFLGRRGYRRSDADLLTLQLLTDFSKVGAARRKKGLTLGALTKALKSGLITIEAFRQTLADLGYGEDAIELLAAEATPSEP